MLRLSVLIVGMLLALCAGATERPNVVVVVTDDQGWGDLSLHGNTALATPHLDQLANEGLQLTQFFVQPVCSPTRAEFLTGRYYPRGGVYATGAGGERLNADEQTIADVFRYAGYATGAFGKWHNGTQAPYHPLNRGFDRFYGFTSGHWGSYFDAPVDDNGKLTRCSGYLPDALTTAAMAFIDRQVAASKPFFTYLALPTPHSPMQTPDADWARFRERAVTPPRFDAQRQDVDHTRAALAMVENIDHNVGRLLSRLDALRVADNTIVVFFSDNGPNGHRWNGDLRGIKGATDEGGVRSPLFIRWPATLPAGQRTDILSGAIDLLPTLAALAGIEWQPPQPLDGVDLSATLTEPGRSTPAPRTLHAYWGGRHSVRTARYRLDHDDRLYDLVEDPGQLKDISALHPDRVQHLRDDKAAWAHEVGAGQAVQRPLTVGYPGLAITQLPARDAHWDGGIERSSRWPNHSYLRHWQSGSDRIYWPVDVGEAGDYRVTVYYTAPGASVGTRITLESGQQATSATVTAAHDPPETGMAQDRVPRTESYVKDFRPLDLGTIRLEPGRGTLRLAADPVYGPGLDFSVLLLERIPQESDGAEERT